MAIREQLIVSYLVDEDIYAIIGHDFFSYSMITAFYMLLLGGVFVAWYGIHTYVRQSRYVSLVAAIFGIVLYVKGLLTILDRYLDAILITDKGLVLFKWDGLFKHAKVTIQRVSVETVTYVQNSFRDTLFKKGNIVIYVEDEQYTFKNAADPALSVSAILERKERIVGPKYVMENQDLDESKSKYEMLVEALGEVVSEYVEKRRTN